MSNQSKHIGDSNQQQPSAIITLTNPSRIIGYNAKAFWDNKVNKGKNRENNEEEILVGIEQRVKCKL